MAGFDEITRRFGGAFRNAQEAYSDLGRFQRLRILMVAALVLDVAVTLTFVAMLNMSDRSIAVTLRADFQARLVVVRNQNRVLTDAQLVLDDKYRYRFPRLELGSVGVDLRDFRDDEGLPPDGTYRPQRAVILSPQNRYDLNVGFDEP